MANLLLKRIKDWATSITSFRGGDVIPVDGPSGTAKMSKDDLLARTAENALVDNLSPKFDPTKPDDAGGYAYYAGTSVFYEGKNYVFAVNHRSGPWNFSEVEQKPLSSVVDFGSVGEAVNAWLDDHPEATTTVQDGSLTEAKFSNTLKLQTIKDYVTPEMFGAVGDGVTDDTQAFTSMFLQSPKVVYLTSGKTYIVQPLDVSHSLTIIGGRGSVVKAADMEQSWVFRFLNRNIRLYGVVIDGAGNRSNNAYKGTCIGLLFVSASGNTRDALISCTIQGCGKGVVFSNTSWNNYFVRTDFTYCDTAFVIGEESGTYLLFDFMDCNFTKSKVLISCRQATHFHFGRCAFSSQDDNSVWFARNMYSCQDFVWDNCNFEEVKPPLNGAAIYCMSSSSSLYFRNCVIHTIYASVGQGEESSSSIFYQTDQSTIILENTQFSGIGVNYALCIGTSNTQMKLDYSSLASLAAAFGGVLAVTGVVGSTKFEVTDCANVSELPSALWPASLNSHFNGMNVVVNNGRRYCHIGGVWCDVLNSVPTTVVESANYSITKYLASITNGGHKVIGIPNTNRVNYCTDRPPFEGSQTSYYACIDATHVGGRIILKWTYIVPGSQNGDYIQVYYANIRNDSTSVSRWYKVTMSSVNINS